MLTKLKRKICESPNVCVNEILRPLSTRDLFKLNVSTISALARSSRIQQLFRLYSPHARYESKLTRGRCTLSFQCILFNRRSHMWLTLYCHFVPECFNLQSIMVMFNGSDLAIFGIRSSNCVLLFAFSRISISTMRSMVDDIINCRFCVLEMNANISSTGDIGNECCLCEWCVSTRL